MMDVSASSYWPVETAAAAGGTGQEKKTGTAKELGQNEFLQLLITQLENQDPMNPIKNEEYIAQLATFSSLEQLVAIKEGINQLVVDQDQNVTQPSSESKG